MFGVRLWAFGLEVAATAVPGVKADACVGLDWNGRL